MLAFFALSFALRAAFLVLVTNRNVPFPTGDEGGYDGFARRLLEEGVLAASDGRAPGVTLFLWLGYAVFGYSVGFGRWVCVALTSLGAPAVYALLRQVYRKSDVPALIAGLFWCVYPASIFWGTFIMSENPAPILAALAVLFCLRAMDNDSILMPTLSGLLFALFALTRPQYLYLPVFLMGILVVCRKVLTQRLRTRSAVILVAAYILGQVPWLMRNYAVYDRFMLSSPRGGKEIACSNCNLGDAMIQIGLYNEDPAILQHLGKFDAAKRNAEGVRLALASIREHPFLFANAVFHRALNFWSFRPNPAKPRYSRNDLILLPIWLVAGVLFLLSFRYRSMREDWVLLGVVAYAFLMALPFYSFYRFRFPVEPLILARAIPTGWELWRKFRKPAQAGS